jgi:hypothetical protein
MNSVSEKIDERILRLLSLEDVFDIDYDTYLTLLKEAIVAGSKKLPQEELAILANERKRIRGKKGRFKPKKEKITADKVATTKFLKPAKKTSALSSAISKPEIRQQDLTGIGKPLESISKTLAALLKFSKKTNEEERRDKESQKRTKREEGLEGFKKGISAVSGAAKKMLAPFQSIIDRIWKFIFFTLLGRAFTQLMDWLGNPANKKKIDVLGRFLKDWWPTLLGAAVLFFTPFGGFVRKTLSLVGFFAGKLVKAIPQIANAVKGLGQFALFNPVGQTIAGSAAAGVAGAYTESRIRGVDETLLQRRIEESKKKGTPLTDQEIEKIKIENLQKSTDFVQGKNLPGSALAAGGSVPNLGFGYDGIDGTTGQKVSGFGPDTQMIAAQPGEIVINKKTVDAVGADTFLGLNRQYGGPGANKPKYKNNVTSAFSGGMIPTFRNGGMVGGGTRPTRGENPRMTPGDPDMGRGSTAYKPILTFAESVRQAQSKLLEQQAQRNTNINTNIAPWWQRINPFSNKLYHEQLPSHDPGERNYNMPGYDRNRWYELDRFRTRPEEFKSKPNPKQGSRSKYAPYYERPGVNRPLTLQGGGLIGGLDSLGRGVFENIGGTIGRNKGRQTNLPGGEWFGEQLGEREGRKKYEQLTNPFRKQSGGLIKENTGKNIMGATADRQMIAAQPGEFVIPVDTVNRLGTSFFEKLVAVTDSNSNAARFGKRNINQPQITPLSRGQSGMMTLPPITQSASGGGAGSSAAGSKVPAFSASSPSGGAERSMNTSNYGILG